MAILFSPIFTAVNSNGFPIVGAKLYTYEAGTTTPIPVYQDAALTVAHTNPVVADAAGRFPTIYIGSDKYKIELRDAIDTVIRTVDNYSASTSGDAVNFYADKTAVQSDTIDAGVGYIRIDTRLYSRSASEPAHNLKVQSLDGAWWEISETIIFSTDATNPDDAVRYAFESDLSYTGVGQARLVVDIPAEAASTSSADQGVYWDKIVAFWKDCAGVKPKVVLAQDTHALIDGATVIDDTDEKMFLEAETIPRFILPTSITFSLKGGTAQTYIATVTFSSPLDDYLLNVPCIGFLNFGGNGSARSLQGAGQNVVIAGDKLSLTTELHWETAAVGVAAPVDITTVDSATTLSTLGSRIVFPRSTITARQATYNGANIEEGFINFRDTGGLITKWIGWNWEGDAATGAHDLLFFQNTTFVVKDYSVFCGAADSVIRASQNVKIELNRAMIGGGSNGADEGASEAVRGQDGGVIRIIRSFMGLVASRVIDAGNSTSFEISSARLGPSSAGIQASGTGRVNFSIGSLSGHSRNLVALGLGSYIVMKDIDYFDSSKGAEFTIANTGGTIFNENPTWTNVTTLYAGITVNGAKGTGRYIEDPDATITELEFSFPNGVLMLTGTGDPETVVTAPVGSTYRRDDGGAGTSFYVKESGAGNTGWVAK